MGSSRLPGKVLLPLNGHTVVEEVIARCKRIKGLDGVVCAIPHTKENDRLARVVGECYRGPEHDVLSRYMGAAKKYGATVIMRITADCPLINPGLCGAVLEAQEQFNCDYSSNVEPRTFPRGYDCEVFTLDALKRADEHSTPEEREHVTPWMRRTDLKKSNTGAAWNLEGRLTLDTMDDYRVICAAFNEPEQRLRVA
jgi:spore coat polysaccharide biosynthesis protein SpsF